MKLDWSVCCAMRGAGNGRFDDGTNNFYTLLKGSFAHYQVEDKKQEQQAVKAKAKAEASAEAEN